MGGKGRKRIRVKMEGKGREEVSFLRLGGKKDVGREGRWWVSLTHQAHRFFCSQIGRKYTYERENNYVLFLIAMGHTNLNFFSFNFL